MDNSYYSPIEKDTSFNLKIAFDKWLVFTHASRDYYE